MKNTRSLSLIIATCALFLLQCKHEVSTKKNLVLKDSIARIVDSFTEANKNKKVYELYIDKVGPREGVLTLFAGEKSLTRGEYMFQQKSEQVLSNGVYVAVYTGGERYFRNQSNIEKPVDYYSHEQISIDDVLWVVQDSSGIYTINKNLSGYYPYMPLPVNLDESKSRFKAPVITK